MTKFEIVDDTLIRRERAYTCEGGMSYTKETPVITKAEFLACYQAWVVGPKAEENITHSCVNCKYGNLYSDEDPCCNCTTENDMFEPK